MFFLQPFKKQLIIKESGFTLLELLVVISLLSVIAGAAVFSYDGIQEQGRDDLARYEMTQIRQALLQFRKDSGTRSFPKQGSYDCTDVVNGGTNAQANTNFVFPAEAGTNDAARIAWCQHAANFWMLFEDPFGRAAVDQWNPDTRRGWNGPYLQRKSGFLSLDVNSIGLTAINNSMWSISDPYIRNQNNTGVNWSLLIGGQIMEEAASPYLFEVDLLSTDNTYQARLISAGSDFNFEDHNANACTTPVSANGEALDQVLCLLN